MRGFAVAGIAVLLSAQIHAQSQPDRKPNCFYTVGNRQIEVAVGASVCRRQPAPYNDKYSLLRCTPPLDEVDTDVKRGDPRCGRYEERE